MKAFKICLTDRQTDRLTVQFLSSSWIMTGGADGAPGAEGEDARGEGEGQEPGGEQAVTRGPDLYASGLGRLDGILSASAERGGSIYARNRFAPSNNLRWPIL